MLDFEEISKVIFFLEKYAEIGKFLYLQIVLECLWYLFFKNKYQICSYKSNMDNFKRSVNINLIYLCIFL